MKRSKTIFMFLTIFTMVLLFGCKPETTPSTLKPKDKTISIILNTQTEIFWYIDEAGKDAENKKANRKDKISWVCRDENGKKLEFEIQFKDNKSPVIACNPNESKCNVDAVITDPIKSGSSGHINLWITPSAKVPRGDYPYAIRIDINGKKFSVDPKVIIPDPRS